MSSRAKLGFTFLALVVILFVGAHARYPGRASIKLPPTSCDATLWQHTYDSARLPVIEECTAAEGRIIAVHFNSDGDVHLELDPDDRHLLNLVNATHMHAKLIAEVVCEHQPQDVPADKNACLGFHSTVQLPKVGDRVRITGAYVTDRDNGWNELHPVTRIEVLH